MAGTATPRRRRACPGWCRWTRRRAATRSPALDADALTGRRVVQLLEDGGERRDLRAVTELHTSDDGDICARVATELDWYRWGWSGQRADDAGGAGPPALGRVGRQADLASRRRPASRPRSTDANRQSVAVADSICPTIDLTRSVVDRGLDCRSLVTVEAPQVTRISMVNCPSRLDDLVPQRVEFREVGAVLAGDRVPLRASSRSTR